MSWKPKAGLAATLISLVLAISFLVGCAAGSAAPAPAEKSSSAKAEPAAASTTTFANSDLLVEARWLSERLSDAAIRIVDVRTPDEYKAGHVKGAVSLPINDTFNPTGPSQMAGSAEQIEKVFGDRGISNDTRVIVYDNGKETKAARILWTLEYFGHTRVAVLNGGFKKWQKDALAVEKEETKATPSKFSAKAKPSLLAAKEDILGVLKKPGYALVDARSPEEYRGEDLRTKRGGRIPGAVNIDWREMFTNEDAPVLKSPADIKKMYEQAGVTSDKEVIAYCQTGQRSAVTYLTLRLLGYEKVRNYDGSWQEWGNEAETPIEK